MICLPDIKRKKKLLSSDKGLATFSANASFNTIKWGFNCEISLPSLFLMKSINFMAKELKVVMLKSQNSTHKYLKDTLNNDNDEDTVLKHGMTCEWIDFCSNCRSSSV